MEDGLNDESDLESLSSSQGSSVASLKRSVGDEENEVNIRRNRFIVESDSSIEKKYKRMSNPPSIKINITNNYNLRRFKK